MTSCSRGSGNGHGGGGLQGGKGGQRNGVGDEDFEYSPIKTQGIVNRFDVLNHPLGSTMCHSLTSDTIFPEQLKFLEISRPWKFLEISGFVWECFVFYLKNQLEIQFFQNFWKFLEISRPWYFS